MDVLQLTHGAVATVSDGHFPISATISLSGICRLVACFVLSLSLSLPLLRSYRYLLAVLFVHFFLADRVHP